MVRKFFINGVLITFIFLDLIYVIIGFYFPELWFKIIHGTNYVDHLGLLQRMAAVWAAFALFQFIALFRWQKSNLWLVLVAGLRLSELFADWTYLFFADKIALLGWLGLVSSTPINFITCAFLLTSYLKMTKQSL